MPTLDSAHEDLNNSESYEVTEETYESPRNVAMTAMIKTQKKKRKDIHFIN